MASKTLKDIADKMAKLDICMFTTHGTRGVLATRPMSNNGDVEYDGNSYYFSYEGASVVKDIAANAQVGLGFQGTKDLYISINGTATLVHSKAAMKEHWLDELKQWFKDGLDTEGLVMIHVKGSRATYWQGEEKGEVVL